MLGFLVAELDLDQDGQFLGERGCGGRPARAKAKNLLKALWPRWSQAPELGKDAKERVVQPIGPGVQE